MSQGSFVVTLHGHGFDRLAARSASTSRCRFGGVISSAVSVQSTYALCLLPPADSAGEALVEFSVNGQDYISQSDRLVFDVTNLTNATGGVLALTAKDEIFHRSLVPFPDDLPNVRRC